MKKTSLVWCALMFVWITPACRQKIEEARWIAAPPAVTEQTRIATQGTTGRKVQLGGAGRIPEAR